MADPTTPTGWTHPDPSHFRRILGAVQSAGRDQSDTEVALRPVAEGRFNECWRVTGARDGDVLVKLNRTARPGHLPRVARLMAAARAAGVRVPRILAQGSDPVLGPYLVQEWISGTTLADVLSGSGSPPTDTVWAELARQIARFHAQANIGEPGHSVTAEQRLGELTGLLEQGRAVGCVPDALAHRVTRWATGAVAGLRAYDSVVVHEDLHPGNILLTADGGVALLDFDHSRHSDTAHDFVKLTRWCIPSEREFGILLTAYWKERGTAEETDFLRRLAFYRVLSLVSYCLYWADRSADGVRESQKELTRELEMGTE